MHLQRPCFPYRLGMLWLCCCLGAIYSAVSFAEKTQHKAQGHSKAISNKQSLGPSKGKSPPPPPVKHPGLAPEKGKQAPDEAVEDIEPIEEIEPLENPPTAAGETQGQASASVQQDTSPTVPMVVGRLHPAFVHMPIAWLVLLCLLELALLHPKGLALLAARKPLTWLACLACLPALSSGWLRMNEVGHQGDDVLLHRNIMFLITAMLYGVAALQWFLDPNNHQLVRGRLRWAYLALIMVMTALMGYGAHLGGQLIYGTDYLPF